MNAKKTNRKQQAVLGKEIERMSWTRLAAMYFANKPGSQIRKEIVAEARRCGYTPSTLLNIHFYL